MNVTSIVMCFEFVKYEAGNLIIISTACLSVLMIMSNIGSKTLDYLHEFKKKKVVLVHSSFLIKYSFED